MPFGEVSEAPTTFYRVQHEEGSLTEYQKLDNHGLQTNDNRIDTLGFFLRKDFIERHFDPEARPGYTSPFISLYDNKGTRPSNDREYIICR